MARLKRRRYKTVCSDRAAYTSKYGEHSVSGVSSVQTVGQLSVDTTSDQNLIFIET